MSFLRFVALLALAFWIGGLAALGVEASTIFSVLEAHDPLAGRDLAAMVFGRVFTHFQEYIWIAGLVLLVSLATRAALGPRPRRMAIRVWTCSAMLLASLATAFLIAPRIDGIREATARTGGTIAALPDADAAKIQFGRLHALSGGLMLLTMAAGAGLLLAEMTDPQ